MRIEHSYAVRLASWLDKRCDDECESLLGPTDAELCAEALRYMAKRNNTRNKVGRLLCAIVPAICVGLGFADLNGDGQSTFADVAVATAVVWHGVPRIGPENAVGATIARASGTLAPTPTAPIDISRSSIVPMAPGNSPDQPVHRRS